MPSRSPRSRAEFSADAYTSGETTRNYGMGLMPQGVCQRFSSTAAIPHLGQGGRIINIGSCLGERVPWGGITVYSMTKSAMTSFTRRLSRELGPRGITVNTVQPGPTATDMNPSDGENAGEMKKIMSLGEYSMPEDIAAAVVFLAGPGGKQITGTAITVDGGANA